MTPQRFNEIREELGLTIAELAAAMDVTRQTASRYCNDHVPQVAALAVVALKYGLKPE